MSTSTIEGAGVSLACTERGSGPPVLLLHGIGETKLALEPALEALAPRARAIAYDRRGYGDSGAPEPYERTTVEEQAEDAAALLEALGADGAVAVGRDFSALICLDLLHRHPRLVRAAVVSDPWFFALTPEANEPLAAERAALQELVFAHGPAEAVRRSGGDPDQHAGFFADFGGSASWTATRPELRAIAAPVRVLVTDGAPAHVALGARALVKLLPGSTAHTPDADPLAAIEALLP